MTEAEQEFEKYVENPSIRRMVFGIRKVLYEQLAALERVREFMEVEEALKNIEDLESTPTALYEDYLQRQTNLRIAWAHLMAVAKDE